MISIDCSLSNEQFDSPICLLLLPVVEFSLPLKCLKSQCPRNERVGIKYEWPYCGSFVSSVQVLNLLREGYSVESMSFRTKEQKKARKP